MGKAIAYANVITRVNHVMVWTCFAIFVLSVSPSKTGAVRICRNHFHIPTTFATMPGTGAQMYPPCWSNL